MVFIRAEMTENMELTGIEFFDPSMKKASDCRRICRVGMVWLLMIRGDRGWRGRCFHARLRRWSSMILVQVNG
jgi:hypothetical protein